MATLDGFVATNATTEGATAKALFDRLSSVKISQVMGRYTELALRGRLFHAANQALATLSTLSTTCTGFALTNPNGSGVNVALLHIGVALASVPAGVAPVHLAYSPITAGGVTHTTPLTVRSGLLEGFTGKATADGAATLLATPVIIRTLNGPVANNSISPPFISDFVDGEIIIQPGSSLSLGYLTTASSVVASMMWAEFPQ